MALGLAAGACVEAKQYTPTSPPVPELRQPSNGSYQGSIFAGSLRPRFQWEIPESEGDIGDLTYELQHSTDPNFGVGTISLQIKDPTYQPEEAMSVARTPPVGTRYYWRVRSCVPLICSDYSAVWYVNLGRSERDLNGDGYADIAVGAPGDLTAGGETGKVYVYFGGAGTGFDTTPDGVLQGTEAGGRFGLEVASGGDFNGDGFADLLVGAPRDSSVGILAGRTYLYLGGPGSTFKTTDDGTVPGFSPEDNMGASLSLAGDLDGDGFSDAVMGAPGSDAIAANSGRAYVYFGRSDANLAIASVLDGERTEERFAKRLEIVSDLNGDGLAELAVDDGPRLSDGGSDRCTTEIFLGHAGRLLGRSNRAKISSDAGARCGLLASDAGDLNHDGYGDLLVGYTLLEGKAGFLLGKKEFEPMARVTTVATGLSTLNVVSSGDFNGDEVDDVVIGGDGAKLYWGRKENSFSLPLPSGAISGPQVESLSVADLNSDGLDDLVVGAPFDGVSGQYAGRVFVYLGAPGTWDGNPDGTLAPGVANSFFGADLL